MYAYIYILIDTHIYKYTYVGSIPGCGSGSVGGRGDISPPNPTTINSGSRTNIHNKNSDDNDNNEDNDFDMDDSDDDGHRNSSKKEVFDEDAWIET
jgi:hypothetical protein